MKPLDSVQRALVTKKCIIKPELRYEKIMGIVNGRQFQTDPYLKELGITVDANEMLQIKGEKFFIFHDGSIRIDVFV